MNPGYIYAIGASITWGLVYVIDQELLTDISPIIFLFVTTAISSVVTLAVIYTSGQSLSSVSGRGLAGMLVAGLLSGAASYLILSAIKMVGAESAAIIEIAYPFFVALFALIFFGTEPSANFYLGGLLIFIGSALVIRS